MALAHLSRDLVPVRVGSPNAEALERAREYVDRELDVVVRRELVG
jgi:hypothetical protein